MDEKYPEMTGATDTAGGRGGAQHATLGELEDVDDTASTTGKQHHREATGTTGGAGAAPTGDKTVDGGATGSSYVPEPSQNAEGGSGAVDGGGSGAVDE